MIPDAAYRHLAEDLRYEAARRGPFDPMAMLRDVADPETRADDMLTLAALSALRKDCTVIAPDTWLMRPSARRAVLAQQGGTRAGSDRALTTIEAALAGLGAFAPDAIDALISTPPDPDQLRETIVTLDRAGDGAPAHDRIPALRAALNHARETARRDLLLAAGFFGRERELARAATWIARDVTPLPLQTLHVSGLPGVGKSFLLERILQKAERLSGPIMVHLDFDRAALEALDSTALFDEISRQIGDGVPQAAHTLRALRLASTEEIAAAPSGNANRRRAPRRLLAAMAEAVAASGRPLLVVLDTLEVLRSRGETLVMTLFEQLDLMAGLGINRVILISAGRGDALDPVPERVGAEIRLSGLEDAAARALLARRGVAETLWPHILPIARGNPLLLILAAKAFEGGAMDLDQMPETMDEAMVGAYLYRAILSRVPPHLAQLAREGLILRRINAETLVHVIAPALGMTLSLTEAEALLEDLRAEHWLVEIDDGWVRHRSDVRSAFLRLIYADAPDAAAMIDATAARWFADREPHTALYHQLQLSRTGAPLPPITAELAQHFTDAIIDDLPERARDAVRQAKGQRSDYGRAGAAPPKVGSAPPRPGRATSSPRALPPGSPGRGVTISDAVEYERAGPATRKRAPHDHLRFDPGKGRMVLCAAPEQRGPAPDPRAVRDLELMIESGELREADYVLAHGFERPTPLVSHAALMVMALSWLTGQWSLAQRIFEAQDEELLDQRVRAQPQLMGRIMLELWAEFRFDALVVRLDDSAFCDRALSTLRQSDALGLQGGALDFALLSTEDAAHTARELTLSLGLLHPALPFSAVEAAEAVRDRAARLRRRSGLFLEAGTDHADHAASVAVLSPYGRIIDEMATRKLARHDAILGPSLHALAPLLPRLAALMVPGMRGLDTLSRVLRDRPEDVLDGLDQLGLSAEWTSGLSLHRSVPDLPAVAAATERWRCATAGLWHFGTRKPPGWKGAQAPDAQTAALAARIASRDDAEGLARSLIWIWADPGAAELSPPPMRAKRRLKSRYDAALAAARAASDPVHTALASLQDARVPGAIAAALAVLAARGCRASHAFRPLESGQNFLTMEGYDG